MSASPGGWLDRLVGWCVTVLLGVVALYCAVRLLETIWPTLAIIIGSLTLIGLGVVVFRTLRQRW